MKKLTPTIVGATTGLPLRFWKQTTHFLIELLNKLNIYDIISLTGDKWE